MTKHEKYIAAAKARYEREGALEFDDNPAVSKGEGPGAYVQCWVWVSDSEAGIEKEE